MSTAIRRNIVTCSLYLCLLPLIVVLLTLLTSTNETFSDYSKGCVQRTLFTLLVISVFLLAVQERQKNTSVEPKVAVALSRFVPTIDRF